MGNTSTCVLLHNCSLPLPPDSSGHCPTITQTQTTGTTSSTDGYVHNPGCLTASPHTSHPSPPPFHNPGGTIQPRNQSYTSDADPHPLHSPMTHWWYTSPAFHHGNPYNNACNSCVHTFRAAPRGPPRWGGVSIPKHRPDASSTRRAL